MTTVLESCHVLHQRPQFAGVKHQLKEMSGNRLVQVRTAPCGCVNYTTVVQLPYPQADRLSGDGSTHLCAEHSYGDNDDSLE
jgi:hypothetical protein